jgi:hypothetical protein
MQPACTITPEASKSGTLGGPPAILTRSTTRGDADNGHHLSIDAPGTLRLSWRR